jgi:hypothetical protein
MGYISAFREKRKSKNKVKIEQIIDNIRLLGMI